MNRARNLVLSLVVCLPIFSAAQSTPPPSKPAPKDDSQVKQLKQELTKETNKYNVLSETVLDFEREVRLASTMSPSPLKVRGGSVKGIYYNGSWSVTPSSTATQVAVGSAASIYLDGVDPANAGATNTPGEQAYAPAANWVITVTFRKQDGSAGEDIPKMYICTFLDKKGKCAIDSDKPQPPGNAVYFEIDSGTGLFNPLTSDVADLAGMRFDRVCNGGNLCAETDPSNHIHSIKVDWLGSKGPYKHHCVDAMCVIAIGP